MINNKSENTLMRLNIDYLHTLTLKPVITDNCTMRAVTVSHSSKAAGGKPKQ